MARYSTHISTELMQQHRTMRAEVKVEAVIKLIAVDSGELPIKVELSEGQRHNITYRTQPHWHLKQQTV